MDDDRGREHITALDGDLPLGDYRPGRWAWLLEDVVRLVNPVPARGRQGLWFLSEQQLGDTLRERREARLLAAGKPEGHR